MIFGVLRVEKRRPIKRYISLVTRAKYFIICLFTLSSKSKAENKWQSYIMRSIFRKCVLFLAAILDFTD